MDLGYVLLVGAFDGSFVDALGAAIPVVRCPGGAVSCPAIHGDACAVRSNARVTAVHVGEGDDEREQRLLSCVGASESRVVVVIEDSDIPPRVFGRFAVVGAAAGPLGVLAAIAGVIEADETAATS